MIRDRFVVDIAGFGDPFIDPGIEHPALYKENGFKEREKAEELIAYLSDPQPVEAVLLSQEKKQEKKNPPLLFTFSTLKPAKKCSSFIRNSRLYF